MSFEDRTAGGIITWDGTVRLVLAAWGARWSTDMKHGNIEKKTHLNTKSGAFHVQPCTDALLRRLERYAANNAGSTLHLATFTYERETEVDEAITKLNALTFYMTSYKNDEHTALRESKGFHYIREHYETSRMPQLLDNLLGMMYNSHRRDKMIWDATNHHRFLSQLIQVTLAFYDTTVTDASVEKQIKRAIKAGNHLKRTVFRNVDISSDSEEDM